MLLLKLLKAKREIGTKLQKVILQSIEKESLPSYELIPNH